MSEESTGLARTVNWKQGMFIALGVPLLIVPSLYDVEQLVWGLCIVVWTVSVLQGFVQNLAYGEMVTLFPNATGLPGCAQAVFTKDNNNGGIDKGKLIGAFSAWCYWFAWCPVVAIFTMMIGDYLVAMFSIDWTGWTLLGLYMLVGIIVVLIMYILSARGLEGGATVGTILALISMIPIIIILIGGLAAGMFDFSTITSEFTSPEWSWYKEPGKDVPKALFGCGIICLIMYFFVSTVVFGSLGHEGIADAGYATLRPIAETAFGEYGSYIALFFLIVAMLLVIQTGFLGSSRTLNSMAGEGNLPKWFGKLNSHGMPANAMLFVGIFNLILVFIIEYSAFLLEMTTTSMTVLTASALGYCLANGIALSAFVITRRNARFKDLDRPFKAPKGWQYVISSRNALYSMMNTRIRLKIPTNSIALAGMPCLLSFPNHLGRLPSPAMEEQSPFSKPQGLNVCHTRLKSRFSISSCNPLSFRPSASSHR